jgi:hypothetical protein
VVCYAGVAELSGPGQHDWHPRQLFIGGMCADVP